MLLWAGVDHLLHGWLDKVRQQVVTIRHQGRSCLQDRVLQLRGWHNYVGQANERKGVRRPRTFALPLLTAHYWFFALRTISFPSNMIVTLFPG
jgi:hypothetical protein